MDCRTKTDRAGSVGHRERRSIPMRALVALQSPLRSQLPVRCGPVRAVFANACLRLLLKRPL
jgi:hypothetical protein